MSDEAKARKFENEEPATETSDDVEAHQKSGKVTANVEPKDDDNGDDDVEAHFKAGKTL